MMMLTAMTTTPMVTPMVRRGSDRRCEGRAAPTSAEKLLKPRTIPEAVRTYTIAEGAKTRWRSLSGLKRPDRLSSTPLLTCSPLCSPLLLSSLLSTEIESWAAG
eukprot:3098161-Pyramimonas_sp.AAC.1